MNQAMATSGLFPGASFADLNVSGYIIDTLPDQSEYRLFNPVFINPDGDTLLPASFSIL
ncbi:MAG: hypothetical protein R3B47_06000 [Bacteroidia bacterium]